MSQNLNAGASSEEFAHPKPAAENANLEASMVRAAHRRVERGINRQTGTADGAPYRGACHRSAWHMRHIIALAIGLLALLLCCTGVGIPFAMVLVGVSYGISNCKQN